jgi:hypothetical protein
MVQIVIEPKQDAEKVRQRRSQLARILNVPQEGTPPVLAPPAALLDGLFEHPAGVFCRRPRSVDH